MACSPFFPPRSDHCTRVSGFLCPLTLSARFSLARILTYSFTIRRLLLLLLLLLPLLLLGV